MTSSKTDNSDHDQAGGASVRDATVQQLESLQRAGITHLPQGVAAPADTGPVESADCSETGGAAEALKQVAVEVANCTQCAELVAHRTQTVFGVGDPAARLCFLGEAPGADEDKRGEPFVGRAGKLLNDILEKGMGLTRDEIYILNILKCRPPGNRNPLPEEADHCRGFLDRQLAILQPEFICCLGAVASQNLLDTTETIGNLRGTFHTYRGIRVLCTYHPAYLLRNPSAKTETWKDIQLLMSEMGLSSP